MPANGIKANRRYPAQGHTMIIPNLPNADYHSRLEVGSSLAKTVLDSIQLYKDTLDGIVPRKTSSSFEFGTQFHMAVLEPSRYVAGAVKNGPINPATGKTYGAETKKYAEWQEANPGKFVADPAVALMIARMPQEVAFILMGNGESELSVFATVEEVAAKCRPDRLVGTKIYDVKTIDSIDAIDGNIRSYLYWFTAAWYRAVMKAETGDDHTFELIFAEKKPPYRWRIVQLSPEYIEEGDYYVRDVVKRIARAAEMNDWSDKSPLYQTAAKPPSLGAFDHGDEQ